MCGCQETFESKWMPKTPKSIVELSRSMWPVMLVFRQMFSSDRQTCNHFLILCAGLQLHMFR